MSNDSRSPSPIRLGLLAVLAIAVVGAGVWAVLNERADDEIAGSIDDFELTFGEIDDILASNPDNVSPEGVVGQDLAQVNSLVATTLLVETAATDLAADGFDPADFEDDAFLTISARAGFDPASAFGEWSIRLESVQQALTAWSTNEIETRGAGAGEPPVFLCSSHILVETEEEAIAIVDELDAGADFATLAIERSTGPSGPGGGDLGCVDPISFVPEFGAAAEANGPGITPPVQTQFGWHVILVRSFGPLTPENHPELSAADIDALLFDDQARADVGQEFLQAAVDRVVTESTVHPRLGQWDPATGLLDLPNGVIGN